jgi:hypothetical protein
MHDCLKTRFAAQFFSMASADHRFQRRIASQDRPPLLFDFQKD